MTRGKNPEPRSLNMRTSPDIPGCPTDFKADEVNPKVVNLTWGPPVIKNGDINHFHLEYTTSDLSDGYTKINTTKHFATIGDLQASYFIKYICAYC
jgi:hypothetical protein